MFPQAARILYTARIPTLLQSATANIFYKKSFPPNNDLTGEALIDPILSTNMSSELAGR